MHPFYKIIIKSFVEAYGICMKKQGIFIFVMVAILFFTAIGLCVNVLNQPITVSSIDENEMRIVVDAGHGGIDGGVSGIRTKTKESDINLTIALKLSLKLQEMGFEVVLTRKTEAGLYGAPTKGFKRRDMLKRKEMIQKAKPTLVLSIHQNFYPSSSTRGAQVFYKQADEQAENIAEILQKNLNALYAQEGVKDRKKMRGDFFMLDCYDCPSALIECGFLSNPKDEALLLDGVWQNKIAEKIVGAVVEFISEKAV